jgi:hypothetical protein
MSNILFKKVVVESAKQRKGVEFTDAERDIVKATVTAKIEEFGGVPYKTVDGKEVINGSPFVAAVKQACLDADAVPSIYAGKGRSWSSYGFLVVSCINKLIKEANQKNKKTA